MAVSLHLTNRSVEAIQPPESGRLEFKDTKTPGLYLRVTARGVRTFSFVGRPKGSSLVERATLGKYPVVKADEARTRALEIAARLAAGVSVAAAQREKRGELTLTGLRELLEAHRGKPKVGKKPRDDGLWRLYIEPTFGRRRLSEIAAGEVETWHRAIPKAVVKANVQRMAEAAARREDRRIRVEAAQAIRRRGPLPQGRPAQSSTVSRVDGLRTANLALSELRAMFNWAMNPRRLHFTGINPATGQDAFPNVERERFLQPDEMARFFETLSHSPTETMRDFFLIALLTGARRSNVASMSWNEVNLDRAEWKVSGVKMKNDQAQTVTLGEEALMILKNRKPAEGGSLFVFPSERSKSGHIVEPKEAWKKLLSDAGIDDLHIHDLRRTLGSWQARTGASLVLIGKSLNHKDPKSSAIYARLDLDPVRQSVDRATSAMFEAATLKPKAKVFELKPALKSAKVAKSSKGSKASGG
jgi:integrase